MKVTKFLCLFLLIGANLYSQDSAKTDTATIDTIATDSTNTWDIGGLGSLNFSQLYYGEYWAAGGENSISGLTIFNLYANYKKGNSSWDNSVDVNLGFTKLNGNEYRKSEDKFDISSKYGKKASKRWNYSALLGLNSQFLEGYNYPNDSVVISKFLAPGYFYASIGMDYKPVKGLSFLISPATGKITLVLDDTLASKGAFGVNPGDEYRIEMGSALRIVLNKEIFKNITANSKLSLFSNFTQYIESIDVDWEVLLTLKVNELISTNISAHIIYDQDVIMKTQFKEFFGVGFTYNFEY